MTDIGTTSVTLAWPAIYDGGSPITSWVVYARERYGHEYTTPLYVIIADTGTGALTAVVRGLAPSQAYRFAVAGRNYAGLGNSSELSLTAETETVISHGQWVNADLYGPSWTEPRTWPVGQNAVHGLFDSTTSRMEGSYREMPSHTRVQVKLRVWTTGAWAANEQVIIHTEDAELWRGTPASASGCGSWTMFRTFCYLDVTTDSVKHHGADLKIIFSSTGGFAGSAWGFSDFEVSLAPSGAFGSVIQDEPGQQLPLTVSPTGWSNTRSHTIPAIGNVHGLYTPALSFRRTGSDELSATFYTSATHTQMKLEARLWTSGKWEDPSNSIRLVVDGVVWWYASRGVYCGGEWITYSSDFGQAASQCGTDPCTCYTDISVTKFHTKGEASVLFEAMVGPSGGSGGEVWGISSIDVSTDSKALPPGGLTSNPLSQSFSSLEIQIPRENEYAGLDSKRAPATQVEVAIRPVLGGAWTHSILNITAGNFSLSITIGGLTRDTQYEFKGRSGNALGWGEWSAVTTAWTETDATLITSLTPTIGPEDGGTQITLHGRFSAGDQFCTFLNPRNSRLNVTVPAVLPVVDTAGCKMRNGCSRPQTP